MGGRAHWARGAAALGMGLLCYATAVSVEHAHSGSQPARAQLSAILGAFMYVLASSFLAGEIHPASSPPKRVPLCGSADLQRARSRACLLNGHMIPRPA
jgi:hypothetical protein